MLGFLFGLINPLGRITDKLVSAYAERQNAVTDQQRIAAEERISTLEARKAIILAAQSDPMERWVRIGFALPFILYLWKLVLWDKLLGWGATDDLSADLWGILYIVLGGYFVDQVVRRIKK